MKTLYTSLEKKLGVNFKDKNLLVKSLTHKSFDNQDNNEKIELRGFGTFFIKRIKAKYSARNPKTSEIIYVPEKNKVRFRASKKLLELINK